MYANPGLPGFPLDVQANLLAPLSTRLVVPLLPLLPLEKSPRPAERLNPDLTLQGECYVMATQFMAAVPRGELKSFVASPGADAGEILAAIDFLHQGW
ncbi:MAG TPA: CcdB family protein [Roseateles sp.]|nr:CcdB family protein [Roseateles sp.]